jgi:hypothetical protein
VNARDNGGRTPLSWVATHEPHMRWVLKMLLQHDVVDVNANDNDEWDNCSFLSEGICNFVESDRL